MSSAALKRERRREACVVSPSHSEFCAVCFHDNRFCRCAGARLYLRAEVARLTALLAKPKRRKSRRSRR